jgi:diguanylate cyclase (GGDEF)-like protein/PAS domain S-box-containing protein
MPNTLRAAFDFLPDAVFCVDRPSMSVSEVNQAACACLGYTCEELRGRGLQEICPPQDIAAVAKQFEGVQERKPATATLRTTQRSKSGLIAAVEWHVSQIREAEGEYWIIVARQLAEVPGGAHAESYGLGLPGHDPLTGLPDRRLFERRLDRAIQRSRQHEGYRFAVCFIDLDGFKTVNDRFGHLVGDRVLCEVARRLVGGVRAGDMAARFGGDEFTIFLDDVSVESDAASVAQRILEHLQTPVAMDDQCVEVKASVGVVVHCPNYRKIEELLQGADQAMYRAKSLGGGRWSV